MNVILITACPSGMATTFLAARRLEQAARQRGWRSTVEMHGELEPTRPVEQTAIDAAELVIVAAEYIPEPQRFVGKRLFQAPISQALPDPRGFLERAEREAAFYTAPPSMAPEAAPGSSQAPEHAPGSSQAPLSRAPEHAPSSSQATVAESSSAKNIVAVTACPTGVAHTFMAAESLAEAGRAQGHRIRVETQGSVGAQDALSEDEIREADVVILACDIEIDPTRFAGKPIWRTSTGNALKKPKQTIDDPSDTKPKDWVDETQIDDPADKKPDGYDDIPAQIPDPDATKPEDWDDEDDGEWEPPLIDNPDFKGEWSAKKIDNPAYKGEWNPAQIPNKDYEEGVQLAAYESFYVGFELWIVNNGTIFDNILVTDDLEYAKKQGEKLWRPTSKAEKDIKEKWDKENKPEDDFGGEDDEGEDGEDEEDEEKDEL